MGITEAIPNLLPHGGTVHYYGKIFTEIEAETFYKLLLKNIKWQHDEAVMFGKRIITKRKVAWYGERPYSYTYSKVTKKALPFTEELTALKHFSENISGETYNSCLLNLYHTGTEGMAWHSDGEKELKPNGAVASMSFGAERKFSFKHNQTKERIDIYLENGSLLVMKGETQRHWLHRLPPTKKVSEPRINLTFRTISRTDGI